MGLFKRCTYSGAAGCAAVAIVLSTPTVVAQEAGLVIEEITVTARKREENIQDVALSVSALSRREIDNAFGTDLRDLVYISPNTVLDDTRQGPGNVAATYIRGIGVSEVEKNFDPAVATVVDGVFYGSMSGSIYRSIDLTRLEILRGPQGTLFGRNTIGGVINVERSKPTTDLAGEVRASYGNYDTSQLEGVFNFGIGENWAFKLSGAYRDQGEGYWTNLNTGREDGQVEYYNVGINPLWTPTDNLEIEYTFLTERTDQDTPPLLNVGQPGGAWFCDSYGWCAPDLETPVSGDRYDVLITVGADAATFDADTHVLDVRWEINDNLRLDYILGSWETEETVSTDWDGVTDVLFHTERPAEYEQLTNELRLTYDAGGAIAGTVGAYVWDSEYEIRLESIIGFIDPATGALSPVPLPPFTVPQTTQQENDSWALFFEGDWRFSDKWVLTLGGRWTDDEKTTSQSGNVPCGPGQVLPPGVGTNCAADFFDPVTAKQSWDEFTPKAALTWQVTEDSMIYGLYSKGYRSGGFNGRVDTVETAVTPYDQETVANYEVGYKSAWRNGGLLFNATAFYMDYDDKQEEIQQPSPSSGTGQVTRVVNAATATISGLELELHWLPVEGLRLRGSLGLLDAEYDDFLVDIGTPGMPNITDFSNLDFRRAPEITGTIMGEYGWQLGRGSMLINASWHYIDEHEVDFANKPELHNDSQSLVDASINYTINDISVSLWGRNLTDEDGYQIGFDVAGLWSYAASRTPRTYGLELTYRWGGFGG